MEHSSDSHVKTNRDTFPCCKFSLYRVEMLLCDKVTKILHNEARLSYQDSTNLYQEITAEDETPMGPAGGAPSLNKTCVTKTLLLR
jgi:hypothetical protein